MKKVVYTDNAATTPLRPEALAALEACYREQYGNPSGLYSVSRQAKRIIETAREEIAGIIGAHSDEIYFTGGGTESDNWAVKGAALLRRDGGRHIITTAVEHHAILNTCEFMEREGWSVTYLPADEYGRVEARQAINALRRETALVSVMAANNEVGTIMPLAEIGKAVREAGVLFHTDAVQAAAHIPIDVNEMHVDMLSMSAHKFGGPKGVGVLYVRRAVKLPSLIQGGGQERTLRGGTENVAGIAAMAAALKASANEPEKRVSTMRDRLIDGILSAIPGSRLTGDPLNRLPGSASFIFECVQGEYLIAQLDREGICASSGSACSANFSGSSHVLRAMGISDELAHGSLRMSLGLQNTADDVEYIVDKLPALIEANRRLSPVWSVPPR